MAACGKNGGTFPSAPPRLRLFRRAPAPGRCRFIGGRGPFPSERSPLMQPSDFGVDGAQVMSWVGCVAFLMFLVNQVESFWSKRTKSLQKKQPRPGDLLVTNEQLDSALSTLRMEINTLNQHLSNGSVLFATKAELNAVAVGHETFEAEFRKEFTERIGGLSRKIEESNKAGEGRVAALHRRINNGNISLAKLIGVIAAKLDIEVQLPNEDIAS
jgi:hypothetical protein